MNRKMKGWVSWALLGMLFLAGSASAQATRTWVSGVGDDANPCSRTAPCKTFAGAISKTAALGVTGLVELRAPARWRQGDPAGVRRSEPLRWLRVRLMLLSFLVPESQL